MRRFDRLVFFPTSHFKPPYIALSPTITAEVCLLVTERVAGTGKISEIQRWRTKFNPCAETIKHVK